MTLKRIPTLDALRGLAVIMVMFFHLPLNAGSSSVSGLLSRVAVFGQTGVDLFFVLSGFLITRILLASRDDKHYFRNFYARRSLRIFPLYFGFLALYFFVTPLVVRQPIPGLGTQIWSWTFLQNVPMTFHIGQNMAPWHFWSLAVEEHFYLVWPLIVYLCPNPRLIWVTIALIALAIISRIIMVPLGYDVFYFSLCRMDALSMGALLALMEVDNKGLYARRRNFLMGVGCLGISLVAFWLFVGSERLNVVQIIKFSLIGTFYFCLVGCAATSKSSGKANAIQNSLAFVGQISFGLYVFHPLIYGLVGQYSHLPTVISLVLMVMTSFVTALLSYYYYERRFLRLKSGFSNRNLASNI